MSCPNCIAGELLPGEPAGISSTQGAYLASGSVSNEPSKRAIVLLTDVFGLPLKNCKIIADHLAKEMGCDVWIPDQFAGWPIAPLSYLKAANRTGGRVTGTFQLLRFYLGVLPRFIKAIREEKKYVSIGAVGYCFGGCSAIRLGATDLVQSIIVCHPGPFTVEQAKAIKTPAAWICAEDDQFFDPSFRLKVEAIFAERKGAENFVDYEFKDYKGTVHGFAIRPNLTNPEVKEAYEKSLEQMTAWFSRTLVV